MATIEEIQPLIKELCTKDRLALIAWLEEYEADEWDKQIEADAKAGKLDFLREQALQDYKAGRTRAMFPDTFEDLEPYIEDLSIVELDALRAKLEQMIPDEWDRQMDRDIAAGRLDHVIEQAREHRRNGTTLPLP